jgi:malonyl-CoA/methylmalonyl-CoA synthetase
MSESSTFLFDHFHELWNCPARADLLALVDDERELTYPMLYEAVSRCAGWLQQAGVRAGDRVAITMERSSHLAACILGVMAAGGCPCPLEPRLGAEEAQRRTRVAGFGWIVFDDAHAEESASCGLAQERRLRHDKRPATPPYWSTRITGETDGFLLFTSGSSGKPKGVLQNHRGMLANAQGIVQRTGLSAADRLLHVMPLHHTNGVNNQLLAPLLAGSTVVLANRFRAEAMPQLMERHRPTLLTGVPTMYARMLPLAFTPAATDSLRMLRCGSAPITEELHRRIEEKFGLPLVVSYGLSEATCTSTMNPPQRRKIGSVGTPLEGQDVFLRAPDGQRISRPEVDGEICIDGPCLMTGYLLEGEGLQPADGVIRTGDLGRFDADGYLYITGRLKDVIIRGGENLSPNLIEEVIVTVPGVAACCVVGKAHTDLGEVPVAFVVRDKGSSGAHLTPGAIAGAVVEKLSRIHQPVEWFFLESLPENGTGKVDRRKLREAATAS